MGCILETAFIVAMTPKITQIYDLGKEEKRRKEEHGSPAQESPISAVATPP